MDAIKLHQPGNELFQLFFVVDINLDIPLKYPFFGFDGHSRNIEFHFTSEIHKETV